MLGVYMRNHNRSHHALLYVGTREACLAQIPLPDQSGVDAEVIVTEQLEIDEARALAERAAHRPIAGEKRHFIISCRQMTLEAQNALLKLFEDPPATAQFYIIVPRLSVLLPTLRSRLHLFYESDAVHNAPDAQSMAFLHASFSERLLAVAKLAKEKERTKDTQAMRALIRGVESAAALHANKETSASFLRDVLLVSSYSETRGASHKMLLEHLALSIPRHLSQ